jgi:hypothetical protein
LTGEVSQVGDSSLIEDVRDSFKRKGLEYVSLAESSTDPKKSILTYKDGSGKTLTKEIALPLSELEDVVAEVEALDPDDLADYLLK